jgi:hypothetical protein
MCCIQRTANVFCRYSITELKNQLKEILAEEESGHAGPSHHLRKRAIQEAYEKAIVQEMVRIISISYISI